MMKDYDVVVIGSGAGANIAQRALEERKTVALIDRGPIGGTCLNLGCIPTKMLTYPADRIVEIAESGRLGISSTVDGIDFRGIMKRMSSYVEKHREGTKESLTESEIDLYEEEAEFSGDYTLKMKDGKSIRGKRIFIASGTRPLIPDIKGLGEVPFITNEEALGLKELPKSMIIVGGGYIGVEFAHFFSAMGTKVELVQRGDRLVSGEEPEISKLLEKKLGERMRIHTGKEIKSVRKEGEGCIMALSDKEEQEDECGAEVLMLALGRRSNSDILKPWRSGVETDDNGFIKVDSFLQTSKEGIWAIGDANGRSMFRHTANYEASLAWHNSKGEARVKVDYSAVPHAIFSYPQIASVGLKEEEAKERHDIIVGKAGYKDVAKGAAMAEEDSFAKSIVERDSGKILGFHIIGPFAPILIQEVVSAMKAGLKAEDILNSIHIHPSISELVSATLGKAR